MKVYRPSDSFKQKRNESIDLGFSPKDTKALAYETDFSTPVQVIARNRPQYITKLNDKQYCSTCRTELVLLEKTQKLLCNTCGNAIPVMANAPLLETNQELRPFGTQIPNEFDRPIMIGLVDDEPREPDWEVTQSSGNGRIQHIKLKRGVSPSQYRIKPD